MNIYRVLVVDDYEPWRRYVRAALRKDARWQIVGEASDGYQGIPKAATLPPDLILLDISLPKLDGIQAARRIHSLGAGCRILFVSEHQAADVVGTALATGAVGFVVKSAAGRELI